MIKVGILGHEGRSGKFAEKLLETGGISPSEVIVLEGSRKAGSAVTVRHPVSTADSSSNIVKTAKYVFMCADPSETDKVLEEIKDCISEDTNIISVGFPASIKYIGPASDFKVTRMAPTMISENGKQISVISHNARVNPGEAEYIESLLRGVCNARVYKIKRF